ncbi:hypothetical protein D8B24_15930 [Verminephrobacter aporrectodeae subsp. tuberculatae]|uniref:BPSS1780 family membrane protein n=1 Tax=Verminephrobacter aporrectodeae TaxID=1110389 RepID=UPI00023753E5|nr:BPSS1780 family membrane protein [Verminephrobacter aporrectodeae]MCW8208486.1 hypothetical protein [Verminephrobacter aporrectodeae subsp. tuberculatae]
MKLHIVPARTGMAWVKLGLRVFWRQPMALTALFFLTMVCLSLVAEIPLAGPVITQALLPLATLAMMVAAAEAEQGHFPTPALLLRVLRASRQRLRAMLLLGALYAVGLLGIVALVDLLDSGQFSRVSLGEALTPQDVLENPAMWLAMLLYLVLSLLFWHAPGLVHWHGVPPVKALFFSIVACLHNFRAFLVYGLGWIGVFLLGTLGGSLAVSLLVSAGLSKSVAGGIMVGVAMTMVAMFLTSVVFTFRDCFEPPHDRAQGAR